MPVPRPLLLLLAVAASCHGAPKDSAVGGTGEGEGSGGDTAETGPPADTSTDTDTGAPADTDTDTGPAADTDTDTGPSACDADGDGYLSSSGACGGSDCDDGDANVHPGATEACDGLDADCDGDDGPISGLYFDGATARVEIDTTSLDMGPDWTVEAWVLANGDEAEIGNAIFGKVDSAHGELKLFLQTLGGEPEVRLQSTDGTLSSVMGPASFVAHGWTHVAWVGSSGTFTLYNNGATSTTEPGPTDAADGEGAPTIGASADAYMPAFSGVIADLRISDFARYTADFIPDPELAADAGTQELWKLREGSGDLVTDSAGGVEGTVVGATWRSVDCRPTL